MNKIDNLKKVDWDFAQAKTNGTTHSFHPYPAKFIPQIPLTLIKELSYKGDTVYDPFLGSGTTCVEANALNRNAIGNDVNELAVLISKVKTTPIDIEKIRSLNSMINRTFIRIEQFYDIHYEKIKIEKPTIVNLDLWFLDFVIDELVIIKDEILNLQDEDLRNFCLIALSGIIVKVSRQDSDTRYVRVEKKIERKDVFDKFVKQLNKNIELMKKCYNSLKMGETTVKVADTRIEGIFEENSADLAVTSPPYPNAYDYHLYHKYRLFWLDMNPRDLRKNEIGAHADYSKKNGHTEFDFKKDMEKSFKTVSKILKKDKYFVFVIGDSILKGRNIKNNELLREVSENTPFKYISEFSRNLNLRKKSFNPKIGNIKTEKILIFKNIK
ncbi:DNA adenine methylase [candidate division KSB1 bacterium]|nr:DNA adenine methylase [candidate division KSB1 bacterium]MBL7093783.1 DNA adenine methylase [candidate division KSB1 bacterium]